MTFREFLRTRRKDQNAIGDIARDALIDPDWKGQRSIDSLRSAMERGGASDAALEALTRAENEYRAAEGESEIGTETDSDEGSQPYLPTRLEWLVLQCNAATNRTICNDENMYLGLEFVAEPPDTVLMIVTHSDLKFETVKEHAGIGLGTAVQLAQNLGWDNWVKYKTDFRT